MAVLTGSGVAGVALQSSGTLIYDGSAGTWGPTVLYLTNVAAAASTVTIGIGADTTIAATETIFKTTIPSGQTVLVPMDKMSAGNDLNGSCSVNNDVIALLMDAA